MCWSLCQASQTSRFPVSYRLQELVAVPLHAWNHNALGQKRRSKSLNQSHRNRCRDAILVAQRKLIERPGKERRSREDDMNLVSVDRRVTAKLQHIIQAR